MTGGLSPKEIVDNCRIVLMKNLVLTEDLVEHLLKNNVLTDLSLKEIKEKTDRDGQNTILLEQLSVKGKFVLERFAESLQICGFNILADMIRDQLTLKDLQFIDMTDLHKRAPRVDKALERREKDDLNTYINQKVHEYSLKASWQKDTVPDKEKAIMAKQKQLEEAWRYQEIIEEKEITIKQLSEQLEQAFKDAENKGVHLQSVSLYLKQLKQKHEEDMKIQIKYNQANDNSLRRQAQQHGAMEKELGMLVAQINEVLRNGNQLPQTNRRQSMMSDGEAMIVTAVDQIKHSLNKLLTHTQDLQLMKIHYDKLKDDCFYVLTHLGRDTNSELRESFQSFIVENEEVNIALRNKIDSLKRELEHKDISIHEQIENSENKLRDLESQHEQLLSDGLQKDSKIKSLQMEVEKLKKIITQLEKQASNKMMNRRPSTPRFKDYDDLKVENSNKSPSPQRITPMQDNKSVNKQPQQSVHLPSIHKKEKSPRHSYPVPAPAQNNHHHHHHVAAKVQNSHRTAGTFQSNPGNPFIVQSITSTGNVTGTVGGYNKMGKTKTLGTHHNTYGKQHSVEVEMKKGLPYYR